jgi:DNA-directed RNA polymerase subunit M/transcription elongation factor TFIIS
MSFTRRIEDFVCAHCGTEVQGSGYTNHCPKCLYSKHVDKDPGDRLEECGGLMEPIRIEGSAAEPRIIHRCQKCGIERPVKASAADDPDAILACAQRAAA